MTKIQPYSDRRIFWLIAAGLTVFVYFFGLSIPLLGPDEPRYAQVAREMFESGDWITPTLGGFNWFEKPALLYWLQIISYNLFGVSEVSARIGPAVFGLGTAAGLWILGRAAAKEIGARDFPNWLALIAATSLGLIVFARGASFDIILTFPMTAAMVGFFVFDYRERTGDERSVYLPLVLFYFFVGVSLLAKGLVGAVFPFGIIVFYYLISRRLPNKVFLASLVWGSLITLAVAATWYLPMYQRNSWEFVDQFFIQHHFQRYTSNKYLHPQPFYFFLWVLPLMTLPWLPFFVAGVWKFVKNIFSTGNSNGKPGHQGVVALSPSEPLLLYAFAWLLVPLAFFSFSGSKLSGYILPALPPALIITTFCVFRFIANRPSRQRLVQSLAIATLVIVTGILIFVVPPFAETDSVKSLIAAADARGFGDRKILTLYTVSHNAEFYAAARLVRDSAGKQKQLNNTNEVAEMIGSLATDSALVIYPLRLESHLLTAREVRADKIKDNGEYGIAIVTRTASTGLGPTQPVH